MIEYTMIKRLLLSVLMVFATLTSLNAQTSYEYDNLYRLTKVTYPNGTSVSYTYDALGNRLSKSVSGATAATYTISVSVTPTGSGTVTGGGTYSKGTSIELNAIPNAGYEFSKWSDGITTNPRTLTVTADQSFTAQFTVSTVTPDLWGDIVVDGKINNQDLNALVDAYLSEAAATQVTDLDSDGSLSIADIAQLVGIINDGNSPVNNNGHKYVDLGLPSGALWATCNVGATAPEEPGDFYAWGETETKPNYSWETYKWCDGTTPKITNPSLTKYCDRGGYGIMDGKVSLDLEDDVAHVKWGGSWHIPTPTEFQELIDHCTCEEIVLSDGNDAYQFTGANGNSIIIPYAGYMKNDTYKSGQFYYWSSEQYTSDIPANNHGTSAFSLNYSPSIVGYVRYRGHAIRPVLSDYTPTVHKIYDAPSSYRNHNLVDLGLPSGTLWATTNVGASSPENYGCYYAWGETTGSCDGKTTFSLSSYKFYDGSAITKYSEVGSMLESCDDTATAKWGGEWRMPTYSEVLELEDTDYTTCEWVTVNGINGYRITSIVKGFEGNSIFLPAGGRYRNSNGLSDDSAEGWYWSSVRYGDADTSAGILHFTSDHMTKGSNSRCYGFNIRPVVSFDAIVK